MKKYLRPVSCVLTVVMCISVLAGCLGDKTEKAGKSEQGKEPITLTFFDKNVGDPFTDPVAKEITKRTGIKFEMQQPTGNPEEKLNLMLASGDLPDVIMMDRESDLLKKFISSGAFISLNDLIDKHGKNIKTMYGDTLKKTRHTDGKNYYLASWYGLDPDPVYGVQMRMKLLQEFAGEKATNGKPFTAVEYVELLRKFKGKYPEVDGKPTIPLSLNGEVPTTIVNTFKGMFGMKGFYEENGKIMKDIRDPRYLEMMKYLNSLYREGLIDKEWAVNKKQLIEQKIASGRVFSTVGGFWEYGDPNNILKEEGGEENQLYSYKILGPGVNPDKATYGPRTSLGWDAIAITSANKHPEETIKLFNFLASEEGQYLLLWGIEGKHWENKDGKHVPKQDVLDGFHSNWAEFSKETGIRKWTWFVKNGNGTDGTPFDLAGKYDRSKVFNMAVKNLKNTTRDTSEYDNLGPDGGTPEALIEQKINDLFSQEFPKIINSSSEEEAIKRYENMLKEMDKNGLKKLEEIYNKNYKERKKLWE